MIQKNILFLIPARKGSKGLKNKNMRLLGEKPLILYSIDFAKKISTNSDFICISTNDESIIELCEKNKISVPFFRPNNISNDDSSSYDVINHAVSYYEKKKIHFIY